MKTIVRYHYSAALQLSEWRRRNAQPPTGNAEVARLLEKELLTELKRTNGEPIGAKAIKGIIPKQWVWRFHDDTWVQFLIKEKSRWFFGSKSRKVIVTAIRFDDPT